MKACPSGDLLTSSSQLRGSCEAREGSANELGEGGKGGTTHDDILQPSTAGVDLAVHRKTNFGGDAEVGGSLCEAQGGEAVGGGGEEGRGGRVVKSGGGIIVVGQEVFRLRSVKKKGSAAVLNHTRDSGDSRRGGRRRRPESRPSSSAGP